LCCQNQDTLKLALAASGCDSTKVVHKPRLLSDNGSSYISCDLAEWLQDRGMAHVRGAPCHPQTQGKIERWHQTLKNRILLENYYLPGELEAQIARFVKHYNYSRYHESLRSWLVKTIQVIERESISLLGAALSLQGLGVRVAGSLQFQLGFRRIANRDSVIASEGTMRPNKPKTTGEGDLFRARLDQIINMKHELVQLAARIDWDWIDREVAPLYSDNGRPGIKTRFVIGLLLLSAVSSAISAARSHCFSVYQGWLKR
jgi:putative transposase